MVAVPVGGMQGRARGEVRSCGSSKGLVIWIRGNLFKSEGYIPTVEVPHVSLYGSMYKLSILGDLT